MIHKTNSHFRFNGWSESWIRSRCFSRLVRGSLSWSVANSIIWSISRNLHRSTCWSKET